MANSAIGSGPCSAVPAGARRPEPRGATEPAKDISLRRKLPIIRDIRQ
jgi:hypothetical protein